MPKKTKPTYLHRLAALIPPPSNPAHAGPISTKSAIEKKLGLSLPADLYELSLLYGSGSFCADGYSNIIGFTNPFSPLFLKGVARHAKSHAGDHAKDTQSNSYPYYPEPGGFLLCATGEADREVYYLTRSEPDNWPLFAMLVGFDFEEFRMSLSEFLFRMFSGELESLGDAGFFREIRGGVFFRPFG